jgi:hypothetical protein
MNYRPKWILAIGLIILIAAGLIGFGTLKFAQYRAGAQPIYPFPESPQVEITSPISGSQSMLGTPIIIQVSAYGPEEIESVELFVNSKFAGTDAAPAGSHFYQAEFLWTPPVEGEYFLIARATGFELLTGYSSLVKITITAPPVAGEASDSPAYPVDSLPDLPGEVVPPEPKTPPVTGEEWVGSVENWINSIRVGTPPEAPELSASVEDCTVDLAIHDLSDNEEGFEVWRLLPNSPAWARIAILASQSQEEWIAFSDAAAQDKTSYYVSAFNSQGVRNSNLVQVELDPRECMPPLAAQPVLVLEMEEFNFPVDRFYCYYSLDGEGWSRSPQVGFYPTGGAAQEELPVPIELVAMNLPGEGPVPEEAIPPTAIYLDCWGWSGSVLNYLGAFSPTLSPGQEIEVGSQGANAILKLKLQDLLDRIDFRQMSDEDFDPGPEIGVFDDQIEEIPPLLPPMPIEPSMPWISSFITDVPESCRDHVPPQWQNESGLSFFCSPFEGFNLGPGGPNPQLYFNWDPNAVPRCPNGQGPQCKDYYYWISLAADLGHEVGFDLYDSTGKVFKTKSITTPEKFNYTIPPLPCDGSREIWVQMWYFDSTTPKYMYGPPSNTSSIPCPIALGPSMFLDIRFDEITIYNPEDNETPPQDLEVYGYLRASSGSRTEYLNLATWFDPGSGCPDDFNTNPQSGATPGCPIPFGAGSYSVVDQNLCRSKNYFSCSETGWDKNNNTIRLVIDDGDSLTLSVKLLDEDGLFDDLVCEGTFQIPGQSILEWHSLENELFTIAGSTTGSGSCQIWGTLDAVKP